MFGKFKIDHDGQQVEVGLLQAKHSNNILYIALPVALLSVVILGLDCALASYPLTEASFQFSLLHSAGDVAPRTERK